MGLFRAILRRSSQRASARYVFEEIGAEILVYCFRWNHIYTDHNVVGNHESEHRLQVGRPQQYVNIKFLQGVVNHRAKMLVSDLRGRNYTYYTECSNFRLHLFGTLLALMTELAKLEKLQTYAFPTHPAYELHPRRRTQDMSVRLRSLRTHPRPCLISLSSAFSATIRD